MKFARCLFFVSSLTLLAAGASAQAGGTAEAHSVVRPRDLKWVPMEIPGAEMALMSGDPAKPGEFTIRIKLANGTKIPPHWHPGDENITVMRGTFALGMGILFDDAKLEDMQPAVYAHIPKEARNFGLAKGETVIQVHGTGPFVVNWVNPADLTPAKTKQ